MYAGIWESYATYRILRYMPPVGKYRIASEIHDAFMYQSLLFRTLPGNFMRNDCLRLIIPGATALPWKGALHIVETCPLRSTP